MFLIYAIHDEIHELLVKLDFFQKRIGEEKLINTVNSNTEPRFFY